MTLPQWIDGRTVTHTAGAAKLLGLRDGGNTPNALQRRGLVPCAVVHCGGHTMRLYMLRDVRRAMRGERLRLNAEGFAAMVAEVANGDQLEMAI